MTDPRFLQIHFLAPYTAALLNRDDAGLAKRLPYGGALRTRVSSQCLKRHWRLADDPHALAAIDGADAAYRSREIVEHKVFGDWAAEVDDAVANEIKDALLKVVYGDKGADKKSRQTLLLGEVEVTYLTEQAKALVAEAAGDKKAAKEIAVRWLKEHKANLKAMSEGAKLPGGLTGALFGRMVTSDPRANIDAAVHVAHAFTVHAEEAESDYFIAADDLAREEDTGADTIQETELTSGLFYGYVVVDVPGLLANLGGDAELAGAVLHNLVYLIAEVSPGAKLGSTAPYSRASLMLLEAGDRQPRSLAEAFRAPCPPETGQAVAALSEHLHTLDGAYATGETRRVMTLANRSVSEAERGTLADLAAFARGLPGSLGGVTSA
ncbi:type I-E CRISPR-associated protein Cas7/Cse4/CasC [Aquicoccus porphyridii]|uniref:Type I-E CRISPR-associated protein Cas7/Cse4/CasC n=1 Tax=Aquicoccus porphyridii TaxID=1852029 RepID=A0A5A9YYE9_9RHOB|nr:type I-E CRISPR-associated protein Cas7/Cse4/CasC [Aquicoccus porphyridii]KAA0909892.1 type I-E CRISPR-associated protein Cas7/Cse4/CasC [Aquicoccus porphyridii]RAI52815.1 type I-E CRISPR-associated protein Cas7/Cse4/CasC [Rhodobacteraceae bacterium AsT-22]